MKCIAMGICVLGLLCQVESGKGELITNTFFGEVTKLRVGPDSFGHPENNTDGPALGGMFGGLERGDAVEFSFVYDSLAELGFDSTYPMIAWGISAHGASLLGTGEFYDRILVNDNSYLSENGEPGDAFAAVIQSSYWASVEFQDLGMDALNSMEIPNTFDVNAWDQQIFGFDADGSFELPGSMLAGSEDNVESTHAYFKVTSFTSSVPEPSVMALFGMAVVAYLARRRRCISQ